MQELIPPAAGRHSATIFIYWKRLESTALRFLGARQLEREDFSSTDIGFSEG
jgi:hypothetical protein